MSAAKYTVLVGIAACFAAAGYFLYAHPATTAVSNDSIPAAGFAPGAETNSVVQSPLQSVATRTVPAGTHEYRSAAYHLSFFYPNELQVKAFAEGGGAATITFQNVSTVQGFQIFIVPYAASQISTARFTQDEPSGIMQSPLNVTVGGVAATSFYSTNALLGDTAEVWFLRGGYLYEVTAPKAEARWLSQILQTLEFI